MNEKELTFRGGVVRNVFTSGAFWERLVVRPGSATLEPWLGKAVTIVRNDVEAVEFVKVRLPFVWRTLVRFRCVDGSVERRRRRSTPWAQRPPHRWCIGVGDVVLSGSGDPEHWGRRFR